MVLAEAPWRVGGAPGGASEKPMGKVVAEVSCPSVQCQCQSLPSPSEHVNSLSFCPKAEVSTSGYKVFSSQTKLILRMYLRNYFLQLSLFSSGQFQISLAELFSSILGNENIFLLRRKFQKLQLSYHITEILCLLEVFSSKFNQP